MENNRRRIPMIHHLHPRSPMCMWLRTPPTRTGHPRCHHDPPRPPQGIHVRPKPLRSGPGIGQSHARLRMPPPAPDAMYATESRGRAGGVRGHGSALGGGQGAGPTDVPAAGCPVPRARWLFMVRGTGDVYYPRTPDHQQPYRSAPVLLQDILLESNLRDLLPWSIGLVIRHPT